MKHREERAPSHYAALRPAEAVALRASSCALPSRGWGQLTLTRSLPRSARAWTGNGTPREPRGLKQRPGSAIRTVPIPPQLVRLLRHHLHAYGCAADGRLFRGARGGPLSESRHGRIWHEARAAAIPDQAGTQPARRLYGLRHAALSPWLASGAPPAEIAARAGHSVRVLLTIYVHCRPGCDQIASQQIDQARHPAGGPRLAHKNPRRLRGSRPPCVRATTGLNGTQLDPVPSTQIKLDVLDLRKG